MRLKRRTNCRCNKLLYLLLLPTNARVVWSLSMN